MGVGQAQLGAVQQVLPDINSERAVIMDFRTSLGKDENLAAQCILLSGMKYIWETRITKKVLHLFKMRAEIEAKISLFSNSAVVMENLINIWR